MAFTIGFDGELFAKNKKGDFVACCGLIGGTKEKPKPLEGLPAGFAIQEDNVAVEFNIPPANSSSKFTAFLAAGLFAVEKELKKLDLTYSSVPAAIFSKLQLKHPNALVFGCEPDYDAWRLVENKKPYSSNKQLRTCGGHIHIGSKFSMIKGVQNMDLFLGVPAVILDNTPEAKQRRELYGKAGAMRPKPYGWEYRVLSNFWFLKPELIDWVYHQTEEALKYKKEFTSSQKEQIVSCINTGDVEHAEALCKTFGIAY